MNIDGRSFPKTVRLLTRQDFQQVFSGDNQRASSRHALLLALHSRRDVSRLGLVVAKKHIRLAVQRNRVKRVTREFFRQHVLTQTGCDPVDLIVLYRHEADKLSNRELHQTLERLWDRLQKKSQQP